jgi:DNA-binding MarR family transcriptional regulator
VIEFQAPPIITTPAEAARYRGHNGCDHQGLPVTAPQARVLSEVRRYFTVLGEGCNIRHLSRRLELSRTTVREHVLALDRKGWVKIRKHLIKPRR